MIITFLSDIYSKRIEMDAGEIISLILKGYKEKNRNMPSFVSNDSNTSFYISMKRGNDQCPVQIRLSNHGTYLRTWVDRTNLENSNERLQDPSHCINISIVFIDDGKYLTSDCEGQTNCDNCQITPCVPQTFDGQNDLGHPFQVQQYTYCSRTIRKRYLKGIVGAIIRALRTGKYTDPLSKVAKRKAANKTLDSSYPITLQNNKTDKNESKNMSKKNTIRLTETDLKRVISESVKKVLRERYEDESNNFGERVKDIMRCVLHDIKTAESRLYSIANSRNKGIHEDDDTMAAYNVLHDCISIFRKNGFDLNVMNGRGTRSSEILRNTGMSRAEALRQKEDEDYWNDGGDISY